MCFFSSCTSWHKPIPYFKGASNQFGFEFTLKCKDQLSLTGNSDGSSTSVFSSIILGVLTPFFLESLTSWKVLERKMPSETVGAILFPKPMQGYVICSANNIELHKASRSISYYFSFISVGNSDAVDPRMVGWPNINLYCVKQSKNFKESVLL